MRSADDTGAVWPVTGHRCRLPLDPVLAGVGTHCGCCPGVALTDAAVNRRLTALGRLLGAVPLP